MNLISYGFRSNSNGGQSIIMSKFIYIIVIVIVIEYIYYVSNFFREAQRYSTRESTFEYVLGI